MQLVRQFVRQQIYKKLPTALVSSAIIFSTLGVQTALAENNPAYRYDSKSVSVNLGELSPAKPSDANQVIQRIRSAAFEACRRIEGGDRLQAAADTDRCIDEATSAAILSFNEAHGVDLKLIANRSNVRKLAQNSQ